MTTKITQLFHVFDTFRCHLRHLRPEDRMASCARMIGRPDLLSHQEFRDAFHVWHKGVSI